MRIFDVDFFYRSPIGITITMVLLPPKLT